MQRTHRLRVTTARPPLLPVVLVGLGPIGLEVAKQVLRRRDLFRIVAAVDRAPHLAGRSLSALLGPGAPRRRVVASLGAVPRGRGVAFHTIASHLGDVVESIETLLARGWSVVSSSEELSYPELRAPALAKRIDRAAKRAGRVVVGTGINPGFAMDVWPLVLASNMQELERVVVHRVVDASQRREPLQRKIGSGMTAREFAKLAEAGRIGHVGLVESAAHLGGALGWRLDRVVETLEPTLASRRIRTAFFDVPARRVSGIHHRAEGYEGRKLRISLDLRMQLGADSPRDEVQLEGSPPLRCIVPGGFHGDRTTVAQLLSAAARLDGTNPGLHLASQLPAPRWAAARLTLRRV
jgi:4-hydroxy-tetrahydrodipicolinate reductase